MLLKLGEQGGEMRGPSQSQASLQGEAQATVGHQEVANLARGCALGFVGSKLGEYLLLAGAERSAVERFEEVGVAEVFAQQADVAANGALVTVQGGGDFGDFGVAVGWVGHGRR